MMQMMWAMVQRQDVSPEEFFQHDSFQNFEKILVKHTVEMVRNQYPPNEAFGSPQDSPVMVLPVNMPGHHIRHQSKKFVEASPNRGQLRRMKSANSLYLFVAACWQLFDLDQSDCHYSTYLHLFYKTADVATVLDMQENYYQRCNASTAAWKLRHPNAPTLAPENEEEEASILSADRSQWPR